MPTSTNVLLNSSSIWFCSHGDRDRINHKKSHVLTCQLNSKYIRLPSPASRRPVLPAEHVHPFDTADTLQEHLSVGHDNNLALYNMRKLLHEADTNLKSVTLIDVLQRLGIDHYFNEDIEIFLKSLYESIPSANMDSCSEAALSFRLLRQAGYEVSSSIMFQRFLDGGEFLPDLKKDTQDLINLHEASYLNMGEEDVLYKAKEFSSKHLASSMACLDHNLLTLVKQTLEYPYHTCLPRYKARQYLDREHGEIGWQRVTKQLARSDFMQLQSLHQDEFAEITSWWKKSGLRENLWFARDQPLKWYFWTLASIPDAKFSKYRILLSKVIAFVYLVDDIYDLRGSRDELRLFTKAIDKWDLSAIDSLPEYMRICYTALYKITNEVAEMVVKEQGWDPINLFIKSWVDLCNAFWVESKWLASKHVPASDDYLRNGIISSGTLLVNMHLLVLMGEGITKHGIAQLGNSYPKLATSLATILRLSDDLGSAKDENQEGLDGSYLECYKKENPQAADEDAREKVERKIEREWEELNKEYVSSSSYFSKAFRTACLNGARLVKMMYTYDDHHKLPMLEDCVHSLLFRSVI